MLKHLQRISRSIESNLILLIILAIIIGVVFGWLFPQQSQGLKVYTPAVLFVMLYPMMIGLSIEQVGKAAANLKLISLSMIFNFGFSPPLAAGLAYLFLHSRPDFAVGLILTGAVPCAGMVAAWTGYAKGNVALAMVIVALSLLVSIIMIPLWMPVLAGVYVQLDAWVMFKDILIVVVIPLILGNISRLLILRLGRAETFQQIRPILPGVSMLGLYMMMFISMALEANDIVKHPQYFLIVLGPLTCLYAIMFTGSVLFSKLARLSYADMVAFSYGVAGKNISIALALAIIFFSPMTVLVLAIKPIIQVAFMTAFLRLSPWLKGNFFTS